MLFIKCLLFLVVFMCDFSYGEYKRPDIGVPVGLSPSCPGHKKPVDIPKSQLKYLKFVVPGKGSNRRTYTYWNAKNIANDPNINFKRKTMLMAVGYLDGPVFPIAGMFAKEYQALGYNIILVDNQRFSTVHYFLASRLMRPVGRHVAEVLVQLTNAGMDPRKLEILGFSLGGHTIAYIAKNYQQMTGRNISRVTALEPSGPCFRLLGPEDRLSPSDADFVDVIHTNIDGYGMATPMGHVDYYVNGGEYQSSNIELYPCPAVCSHFRVLRLWVAALKNPDKFIAVKCDTIQQAREAECFERNPRVTNTLGLGVDKSKHGMFYLSTTGEYPYYLGRKGLNESYAFWKLVSNMKVSNETEVYT